MKTLKNIIFSYFSVAAGGKWGSIGFWDVSDNTSEMHGVQVIKVSKNFKNLIISVGFLMFIFHFSLTPDQSTASHLTNMIKVDWFRQVMMVQFDFLSKKYY